MKNQPTASFLGRDKIYAHPDRLAQWMTTGRTLPITAEIDPTNKCNHKCPDCAGNRMLPDAELSYDNMKTIIDKTAPFLKGIVFTGGGEPLVNPATLDAIKHAHKKKIDVGLVTNGSLFHTIDLKELLSACEWVRISVDAADERTYSKRRKVPKAMYFQTWQNISDLTKTRDKHELECTIGVACLTSDEGRATLEEFASKAKSHRVDYAEFRPYHNSNRNLTAIIDEIKCLETEEFKVIYPRDKYERTNYEYERAFADEFRFVITAAGDVYPDCFTRGISNFCYGNILAQSFEEIWNSKKREEVLRTKLLQKNCPAQCYQDKLSQLLWGMYCSQKEVQHKNFV